MAFWRPGTMTSRNPFTGAFWSTANLFGESEFEQQQRQLLDQRKAALRARVDAILPDSVKDPITTDFPANPVFTPGGLCYDQKTLDDTWRFQVDRKHEKHCPITQQPLDEKLLVQDADLARAYKGLSAERAKTLKMVDDMKQLSDDKAVAAYIEDKFVTHASGFSQVIEKGLAKINKDGLVKIQINRSKGKLHLDNKSHADLAFWNQSGVKAIIQKLDCAKGAMLKVTDSVAVPYDGKEYVVPRATANLMGIAGQKHESHEAFTKAIQTAANAERNSYRSWLCCCTRREEEKQLFDNAGDVTQLNFKQPNA